MTRAGFRAQRANFVRVAAIATLAFAAQVGNPQLGVAQASAARQLTPIVYTLRAPQPSTHVLQVEATVPTERRDSVDLMMAIWSPGYYRVEHYESRVRGFAARATDGSALRFTQPAPNRWRIYTAGRPSVVIAYQVLSQERSVTLNWVDDTLAVLNGAPTFITLAERAKRRHDVRLELAGSWTQSVTSLATAPDGALNHYVARDYDELVDSPIVAGDLRMREFTVGSTRHVLASAGDVGAFDDERTVRDLAVIVEAQRRFWGTLPYPRYVFLNLFRRGGGGLEHLNSTLLTSNAARLATPRAYLGWLQFVSHEYFHAMNVKRLRPVELGPFDYERPPTTTSLWISEGLTSYYGELLVQRSGLSTTTDALGTLSSHIARVQSAPGRLVQTLEQSSLDVWSGGVSGIGRDTMTTVSYYEKGPVVGFLLDARIRRLTNGRRSLDNVMRLAFARHSGERGFTAAEFQKAAEEVAGTSLAAFFRQTLASTDELDYTEALDWFGLQFTTGEPRAAGAWTLAVRSDATAAQQAHLRAWLPDPR